MCVCVALFSGVRFLLGFARCLSSHLYFPQRNNSCAVLYPSDVHLALRNTNSTTSINAVGRHASTMSSPQPVGSYMQFASRSQLVKQASIPARTGKHRSTSAGCTPCSSSPAASSFTDLYLRHKARHAAQHSVATPALSSSGKCMKFVSASTVLVCGILPCDYPH